MKDSHCDHDVMVIFPALVILCSLIIYCLVFDMKVQAYLHLCCRDNQHSSFEHCLFSPRPSQTQLKLVALI